MTVDFPLGPRELAGAGSAFLGQHGARFLPTSFAENFEATADQVWMEGMFISCSIQMGRAWDRYLDDVERTTGKRLPNPWHVTPAMPSEMGGPTAEELDIEVQRERAQRRTYEDLVKLKKHFPALNLRTPEDLRDEVRGLARKLREHAAVTRAGAGTLGDIGAFAGGMAMGLVDPPNLASMLIAGPSNLSLVRAMLLNAGVGAATELFNQLEAVYPWKRELGVAPKDYGEAFENAFMAGVGAGAFTGAAVLGSRALRWGFGHFMPGAEGRAAAIAADTVRWHQDSNPLTPRAEPLAAEPAPAPLQARGAEPEPPAPPVLHPPAPTVEPRASTPSPDEGSGLGRSEASPVSSTAGRAAAPRMPQVPPEPPRASLPPTFRCRSFAAAGARSRARSTARRKSRSSARAATTRSTARRRPSSGPT